MTQDYAVPIAERITELRDFMAARAAESCSAPDRLDSIFLIGSCSEEVPDDWYQDYDVHFLFEGLALQPESLQWLRELLLECQQMSDSTCRIETFLRDRHWKMVPDRSHDFNIGIHATLLNAADHYRRLHCNPLLALNMYRRCYLAYGRHPAEIRGWRQPQLADYALSVGGIGWMAENFARAATLYIVLPEDHTFYPFIAGYCWNVASTLMFHLYTLEQGNVIGRKKAFEYFVSSSLLDTADREAAELLELERENPDVDETEARRIINAAGRVLTTIRNRVWRLLPTELTELPEKRVGVLHRAPLYRGWREFVNDPNTEPPYLIDIVKEEDPDNYLGTLEHALATLSPEGTGSLSPKENFEFLRDLLAGSNRSTKVRVWDKASLPRRMLSHDFHSDRALFSSDAVFFGWEDGVQAILQRLHEVYIEKGTEDAELLNLARVCSGIVSSRLSDYFDRPVKKAETTNFWESTNNLANILRPFLPITTG